MIIYLYIYY